MKRCGACGAEVPERARYCTSCGTALDGPRPTPRPTADGRPAAAPPASPDPTAVPVGAETLPPPRPPSPPPSAATSAEAIPAHEVPADAVAGAAGDRSPLPGGPFDPSPRSDPALVYAGVLVPPDPGPRPRRWGRVALGVLLVAALLGAGAVLVRSTVLADDDLVALRLDRTVVADLPWTRDPTATLVVGEPAEVPVVAGTAVAELAVDEPAELRALAPDARVVVAGEATDGDDPPAAAVDGTVTSFAPGRYRVVVAPDGDADAVEVVVVPVAVGELGERERLRGELTAEDPVLDVPVSPGLDHAWNLVDLGSGDVTAEVRDVTDAPGFAAGEPVCDLTAVACDLVADRDYVVRIATEAPSAAYDLRFQDRPPEGGRGSVTFDGRDAPLTGTVGARRSTTYALVVGVPEGVTVTVTPVGLWDPEVKLDGEVVSAAGPARPEVVEVDAGPRRTLVVGANELGGQYRITVTRR